MAEKGEKIVKTICTMCPGECGLDVHVRDGKIVKITGMPEHFAGKLVCEKGRAAMERVYSPDRLLYPLRKNNGTFVRITWDEALNLIATKLSEAKERYGPWALSIHTGTGLLQADLAPIQSRFCTAFGSPNHSTVSYMCAASRRAAYGLTCGFEATPNWKGTRLALLWASNPINSMPLAWRNLQRAQKQGAKLIVVDPRKTTAAKAADIHAQIRPGTDGALCMSMINVIISEGLFDKEFVRDWTYGFDQLAERAKEYPPEKVEEITWIPAETIRQMARMYATSKPAANFAGTIVEHNTNGFQAERAMACMVAICGNLDRFGGNMSGSEEVGFKDVTVPQNINVVRRLGSLEYPVYRSYMQIESKQGEAHFIDVLNAMLTEKPYPIKALIVQGSNPGMSHADSKRFKQAVKKLDLFVAMDIWMTETCELADIVLPAATFLERTTSNMLHLPLATLSNKAVEPQGECWPDYKFWRELAIRLGMEKYFPWEDEEDVLRVLLEPTGITLEQLKDNPGGVWLFPKKEKTYLHKGFTTPSGKVELYSRRLEFLGLDPLPGYYEPFTSPVSTPDLAKEYPLILTTGARIRYFLHSQHQQLPSLRKRYPDPLVEVNTKKAKELGINEGDMVKVETPTGSIKRKVKVTPDIHPRVVEASTGWSGEANANNLLDDQKRNPFTGYPEQNAVLCRVSKI